MAGKKRSVALAIKNNNFIERSIFNALSFFKESIFSEEYASGDGFLQSIDPRIKTVTFAFFLITALLIKSIPLLTGLYLFCLLLASFSKIDFLFFLKRTWVFMPIFSLFIAIPALFHTLTPGEPLFIFKLFGLKLVITQPGLSSAVLFVTRVITSVSFVVLLGLVTKHTVLFKVLRIFRIPQIFVITLSMCYRYIYLFVEIVENTYLAIKSRVGGKVYYGRGQSIVAWKIASLWQRSLQLNEEVYNAMLSRGYRGEPYVLDDFKINFKDWAWLFYAVIISSLMVYLSHMAGV